MKSIGLSVKNVPNPLKLNFCHGQNCPTEIGLIGQNCPTERKIQKFNRAELPHKKNSFKANGDKALRGFLGGLPCDQVSGAEMPMLYIFTMYYSKFKEELNLMKTSDWRAYTRGIASAPGETISSASGGGGHPTSGPSSRNTSGASSRNTTENSPGRSETSYATKWGTSDVGSGHMPVTDIYGNHNHGVPNGAPVALSADGQNITGIAWFSTSGQHSHIITEGHSHDVDIPSHSHGMDHTHSIDHTHTVEVPVHQHIVKIPTHSHEMEHGIYEGPIASKVTIRVDGKEAPAGENGEIDITKYLATDQGGKILRNTWHKIEITPDNLTRITASVFTQIFTNSRGGGDY